MKSDELKEFLGEEIQESMGVRPWMEGCEVGENVIYIPVDRIEPDPDQPRKTEGMDEASLRRLGESMRKKQLQAIGVRIDRQHNGYRIVFGERRWRAAKLVGLPTIRAELLKDERPEETLIEQLLENCLREDLNPLERAGAYAELVRRGLTAVQIAEQLHVSPATVTTCLRLLEAPAEIQAKLESKELGQKQALGAIRTIEPRRRTTGQAKKARETRGTERSFTAASGTKIHATNPRKVTDAQIAADLAEVAAILRARTGQATIDVPQATPPAAAA